MGLVASAMEVYPFETTGLLTGKISQRKISGKSKKMVVLQTACPIQSAKRRTADVNPLKNRKAFLRAFNSIVAIPKFHIAGEYHSHTKADAEAELSDDDVGYVKERLDDIYRQGDLLLDKPRWLEVVLKITKRRYVRLVDPGWSYSDYSRKARCLIKIPPRKGFEITFSAFWIFRKGRRISKKETDIYIPWTTSRYWV